MPPPRANFACLAAKCQQDGAASIYELPVAATRCPVCGSKRVRRLFDAVQIGSASARAHAQFMEHTSIPQQLDAATEQKAAVKETPVLKMPSGAVLGAVHGDQGAVVYSRGGYDAGRREQVAGSVGLIRALGKPRPVYGG